MSLQLGFDSVHFARIDYQDRAKRKADKSLEVVWRGSKTFGSSAQVWIVTNGSPLVKISHDIVNSRFSPLMRKVGPSLGLT